MSRNVNSVIRNGRRKIRIAVISGIVVLCLIVVGAVVWNVGRNAYVWGTDDTTQALLDNPIADTNLLGLELTGADQTHHVGVLGKPYIFVQRWFKVGDRDPAELVKEVADYAQTVGWSETPDTGDSMTWVGTNAAEEQVLINVFGLGRGYPERVGDISVLLN